MDKTARKPKRIFTPDQKLAILQEIDRDIKAGKTITEAVANQSIVQSLYRQWKKQLAVGVRSSLRNGRAPVDKDKKRMSQEIERLKGIILSQSQMIVDLKKETNWDS